MPTAQQKEADKANVPAVIPGGGAVVPAGMMEAFLVDAGKGFEKSTAQNFAIPFIYLLQDLSPQTKKREEVYVEGAEPGMFFNSVTNELYGRELEVVQCDFEFVYNVWVPRNQGGGYVGTAQTLAQAAELQKGFPKPTQVVDTANHYLLAYSNRNAEFNPAILSLTSTKLGASRKWMSMIEEIKLNAGEGKKVSAPSYARRYILKSFETTNMKGTFFNLRVVPVEGDAGWVADPVLFAKAKKFYEERTAGRVGADYTKADEVVEAEVEDGPRM